MPELALQILKMRKIVFLLLLPLFSLAQNSDKSFSLKGNLNLQKQIDWVYLRYNDGDQLKIDSVQPKNGSFKFEGKIAEPTLASLAVKFVKQPTDEKVQREMMQIFLEPAKMELVAKDSLKANKVSGSKGHTEYAEILKQQKPYEEKLNALYKTYSELRTAGDKEGLKKIENSIDLVNDEMKENVYLNFIKNHPNSTAALPILKQYAGWDIQPDKVEPLFNSLPASTKNLPSAVALKDLIDISKKTAVGTYAMDFTQNDTTGRPVSLSSFKGKYVLVDFWASWCKPCRAENPAVVKVYNKFKGKNFTILGVSLDDKKEAWMKAVQADKLTWNHVSDLQQWNNAVAQLYHVQSIPGNFLIDPNGKIIARDLRGEDLEKKLCEVFGGCN
jgi:peroxiredoxin